MTGEGRWEGYGGVGKRPGRGANTTRPGCRTASPRQSEEKSAIKIRRNCHESAALVELDYLQLLIKLKKIFHVDVAIERCQTGARASIFISLKIL